MWLKKVKLKSKVEKAGLADVVILWIYTTQSFIGTRKPCYQEVNEKRKSVWIYGPKPNKMYKL